MAYLIIYRLVAVSFCYSSYAARATVRIPERFLPHSSLGCLPQIINICVRNISFYFKCEHQLEKKGRV